MVGPHDYAEPRIIIIQPLVVSFLEDASRLCVEDGMGDQSSWHPEPTLSFGTVLETCGCVLLAVHLMGSCDVEDI